MKFWIPWGFDALITLVVLYFFFEGLADGSVSSFNAGIWFMLLVALTCVMGGSLWLRSTGRHRGALVLLLVLAVPGVLALLFLLVVLITNPRWN
jgi:hypothetical protein